MNLKDFKAGTFKKQIDFESFCPAKINHPWVWDDPKVNVLLEKATLTKTIVSARLANGNYADL